MIKVFEGNSEMHKLVLRQYFKIKDCRVYFLCCQVTKLISRNMLFIASFETIEVLMVNESVYIMWLSINLLYKIRGRTIS